MITEWVVITCIAAVLFLVLSIYGTERYRQSLRQWSICAALLCGAFLIGPPIDRAAGAVATFLLLFWLFRLYLSGRL